MTDYTCPECGSTDIIVGYTAPLYFKCRSCKTELRDENSKPAVTRIEGEEARRKRPRMYGLPCCARCFHAPHEGACDTCPFCTGEKEPHVVKLVKA